MTDPEILSRGFVYIKENTDLLNNVKALTNKTLENCAKGGPSEWVYNARGRLKDDVARYIYEQTKRRPMILPIIKSI